MQGRQGPMAVGSSPWQIGVAVSQPHQIIIGYLAYLQ